MSQICKTCNGRGHWQETIDQTDGGSNPQMTMIWRECNDCKGTGVEQDPEAGDDYDIGGDSYADED